MPFANQNLSFLVRANGFTLWHYKTGGDRRAAVRGHNYFEAAAAELVAGDIILVSSDAGAFVVVVALADPGAVVTAALE
jgi:hypothetical protein